jgi:adenylate cyclase
MGASDRTADDGLPLAPNGSDRAPPLGGDGVRTNGRINLASERPLRLGPLAVEPALRRVAHDDGREEILEPRVMQVVVALIRADGQIVSRDDLMMSCWHGVVVGEDAINRVMGRVRRLTDGLGGGEIKLETVTKVGYRLVAPRRATETQATRAPVAGPPDQRVSICVLPFANMSDDPQQEYFSDGISEDIITDLAKVSALSVIARSTAFTFKGRAIDVPQIARQLNVRHVLEGSVRKAGGRVRITAQLIDGVVGVHLWSERWDRDLTDIFALQDEIAQAIVDALKLKLLPEEKKSIERRGTDNVDAYNLYLMARQYLVGGNMHGMRVAETIVRLCGRATEIDPNYARAWALMAWAQTSLHFVQGRPDDGLEAAERALSLDPGLAEARAIRARHVYREGRHAEAFAEIEIAVRLDPGAYEVNSSAALLSFRERRLEDAIGYWEKAATLAEADFGSPGMLIECYAAVGDAGASRRAARTTLARAEQSLARDPSNGTAMSFGVSALAALGETERARDWIERALLIDPDNMTMRYNLACALAADLKDTQGSLELLVAYFETAVEGDLAYLKIDLALDSIREEPRFAAMFAAAEARLAQASHPSAA